MPRMVSIQPGAAKNRINNKMNKPAAAPLPTELHRTLAELEEFGKTKWAFTFTKEENQKKTVARFDPSKEQERQWALLRINEREPTPEEFRSYQTMSSIKNGINFDVTEAEVPGLLSLLIKRGTVQVLKASEDKLRYSFVPQVDIPFCRKLVEKLKGEFVFCKKQQMLETIEIRNQVPFSPVPSVKVNKLYWYARFGRLHESGGLQLVSATWSVKGRQFYVSALDLVGRILYSDYSLVSGKH